MSSRQLWHCCRRSFRTSFALKFHRQEVTFDMWSTDQYIGYHWFMVSSFDKYSQHLQLPHLLLLILQSAWHDS